MYINMKKAQPNNIESNKNTDSLNDKYEKRKRVVNKLLTTKNKPSVIITILLTLKDIIWNPLMLIILFVVVSVFLCMYFSTPSKKYVGVVISVSSWNGNAKLKTKTYSQKDTILNVHNRRNESFIQGQIITVWSGGNLFEGITTTEPQ